LLIYNKDNNEDKIDSFSIIEAAYIIIGVIEKQFVEIAIIICIEGIE